MSTSINILLKNPIPFLDQIFQYLANKKVDVKNYQLDHLCYRVASKERYTFLKERIAQYGTLLTESQIAGRAIASFKLKQPIFYKKREIEVLELPAPKKGSFYKEGFEHVEFVIDVPFNAFMKQYPQLDFITKDLKKSVNPGITLKETDFSVKFHHYSLEYAIRYLD